MLRFLNRFRKRPSMLSCEQADQFLTAYLDDALDPATRTLFEAHLEKCPKCTEFMHQILHTTAVTHAAHAEPEVPAELIDHTLAFLDEHLGPAAQ